MSTKPDREIFSSRLRLRPWRAEDLEPFAAMNADPRVMEFFPAAQTREESAAAMGRVQAHFEAHRFGLWAVEVPGEADFAGFIGLNVPKYEAHFTPCVEIGWRLAVPFWGRGLATEGAQAVLEFAFGTLGLAEVVAMTTVTNLRSRRVMEKLGMTWRPEDDFDHPQVPAGHRLAPHVLYRLARDRSTVPRPSS
jgi:RimJ/RimL family protein N-acetyltransferase